MTITTCSICGGRAHLTAPVAQTSDRRRSERLPLCFRCHENRDGAAWRQYGVIPGKVRAL